MLGVLIIRILRFLIKKDVTKRSMSSSGGGGGGGGSNNKKICTKN